MKLAKVQIFAFLVAFVATNPVMKYSFCSPSSPKCEPSTFASNSTFKFGNITSGVNFIEEGETVSLAVSCSFQQPLRWIFTAADVGAVKNVSSNVTKTGDHLLYFYHIQFVNAAPGLIRCESYGNAVLATEIYIAKRQENPRFYHASSRLHHFYPTLSTKQTGKLIVPCFMDSFDPSFDASLFRLWKLKRSDMIGKNLTRDCWSCFPQTLHDPGRCATSCTDGISKRMWESAWFYGRQPDVNKTGNQWLDCVMDPECAFKTVKNIAAYGYGTLDCNGDGEVSCSDRFTDLWSYPNSCRTGKSSLSDFVGVETCVVKNYAKLIDQTEADYDPRIGFRLKSEEDLDVVFACSSVNEMTLFVPVFPSSRIEAQLQITDNNINGPLRGIFNIVPESDMEESDMEESDMEVSYMVESDMEESDMEESDMEESDMEESDMEESDMEESDMEESDMAESGMEERDMEESEMEVSDMEESDIKFLPCSTIFECEAQLLTKEALRYLRHSTEIVHSEPIHEPHFGRLFYGRLIQHPPRSGVVEYKWFESGTGYIYDLQYYFTGLDAKSYFVSESLPVASVVFFRTTQPTKLRESSGLEIEVACTVATFIVFPNFEFFLEYSNGTFARIENIWQLTESFHEGTEKLMITLNDYSSVVSIICRAPFRNSKKMSEASLLINSLITNFERNLPLLEDGGSLSRILVISTLTSIVFILGLAFCTGCFVKKLKDKRCAG